MNIKGILITFGIGAAIGARFPGGLAILAHPHGLCRDRIRLRPL